MQSPKNKTVMIFFPGPTGGAEMIVAQGFKALLERDPNIELWMIGESRAKEAIDQFSPLVKGLPTKTFQCRSIIDLRLIKELRSELKDKNITIIHAHGFKACVYAKLCLHHQKFILTHHGKTAHTLKVRIYEALEDLIMKRADQVISVSQAMQDKLATQNINSVLVENFLTISEAPKTTLPSSPLKLIFIGRLSPEKGCRHLILAMNELQNANVILSIVGDGIEREELETLSNNQNTTFLGFQKNISTLLGEHHALVMPSMREGLPLTLIEATCNELPVIASNVGGIPTLINHQVNGLLVNSGEVQELKKAINEMIGDFKKFQSGAQALASTFRERFSSNMWAEKTLALYRSFSQE